MSKSPNFKNFLNGVGAFVEMWIITFNCFKNNGFSDDEAMIHTKAAMSLLMNLIIRPNMNTEEND